MTKKITIIIVLAVLCLNFKIRAQVAADTIKFLKVGDKVPEDFWKQEHEVYRNGTVTTENLSAYRGKLLLLDFWATWCGPCIEKFPLVDSLQQQYPGFTVLLVNKKSQLNKFPVLANFMEGKGKPARKVNFPSVINDVLLGTYFPHKVIPHYVWIANGNVRAITAAEFLDAHNVEIMLLKNEKLSKPIQKPN